jgi:uncharacterized protein YciI
MKSVVFFEDDTTAGTEVRRKHMSEHLAFLERQATKIRAAGPLRSSDSQAAGGLWLVEASDSFEVQALVREDPFWPTGLRKSVRIFAWNQVFADGQRLIAV